MFDLNLCVQTRSKQGIGSQVLNFDWSGFIERCWYLLQFIAILKQELHQYKYDPSMCRIPWLTYQYEDHEPRLFWDANTETLIY